LTSPYYSSLPEAEKQLAVVANIRARELLGSSFSVVKAVIIGIANK